MGPGCSSKWGWVIAPISRGEITPVKPIYFRPFIHPRKLTWNPKNTHLKRRNIFQTLIFGFHVCFRGWRGYVTPFITDRGPPCRDPWIPTFWIRDHFWNCRDRNFRHQPPSFSNCRQISTKTKAGKRMWPGDLGPSSHTETEVNGELWVGSLGSFGVPSSYLQKVKVFGRVGVTSISSWTSIWNIQRTLDFDPWKF